MSTLFTRRSFMIAAVVAGSFASIPSPSLEATETVRKCAKHIEKTKPKRPSAALTKCIREGGPKKEKK